MHTNGRQDHHEPATATPALRLHGHKGPPVLVLHGGPAARGTAAPLARALSDGFRVLEPWQRGSGGSPLTVARHVADLDEIVASRCLPRRPALVGESWGAMLALAYAAAHRDRVGALALVGCGTFDPEARRHLERMVAERSDERLRQRLARLEDELPDPDQRARERLRLMRPIYAYDPIAGDPAEELEGPFDAQAHEESWADMLREQARGHYPAAFDRIACPVLMLHGAYDPHPGTMTRDTLRPFLPQLEYREWAQCGHEPWRERQVRDEFLTVLRDWLRRHTTEPDGGEQAERSAR